ncbi:alpha/beta fold hydrolase [Tepidiforma flava]|uniref:Alpha/beta fold hydrolase n=1 Tax=Tepidiforma flava TaxID=3004094 RepID=A0ABY7MAG9_9CHLR|nr:alpha/beta fold hydrolase [Tepidiforma flava]WBL37505.1 alpha/beta fold hydrolase [Tepidiforma flava]
MLEDSGEREISLVGYCMGGQLSTMYAALHTDGPLKNLACFTTPVDSDGMVLFKRWLDPRYFDVDRVVDTLGNVPPELIYASFDMLKPAQRVAKNIQLWDNLWNDDFVRSYRLFERWAADQIPFPGECFRQFTKQFMWENRMVRNELEVGGRRVDLGAITVPFLHVVAEHDHIVPYDSARALVPLIGSEDKREVMLKGGHVSLVAGGNAIYRLWPQLESWLAERSV